MVIVTKGDLPVMDDMALPLHGGMENDETQPAETASERGSGEDEPSPWVVVLEAFNQPQAVIAVARLEDEGIPARIRQEGVSSALPVSVGIIGRISVLVPEALREKALRVLSDTLEMDDDDLPPEQEY